MKPLAFSISFLCLHSWALNSETLAEAQDGALFG